MYRVPTLLTRYGQKPILTPADYPATLGDVADCVFNPGQTTYQGQTILLVSVCLRNKPYAEVHIARSDDGIHFAIDPEPCFFRDPERELTGPLDNHPIDCRVTQIGDTYYIARPGNSDAGCIDLLYKTTDFKTFEFVDIIALPDNRVPCLFPEKINGYYYRLDRPYAPEGPIEHGHIWISRSPDLIHWGHHRLLLKPFTNWNWGKIGPTVPIKTERGYLELIHGVCGSCSVTSYSLGAVLLDLNDPYKILGKTTSYILTAETEYDFNGRTPGCVFATGAIADLKSRELRCYFGSCDTYIGLATGNIDEIIDACLAGK